MSALFDHVYCSQCGGEFGPGDEGYSHCSDHGAGRGLSDDQGRPATTQDYMRLADVMAQRLAEYLYDHEDGKGNEAGEDYAAARKALKVALVSGVVDAADGMPVGDGDKP